MSGARVVVVGIGADGWGGLGEPARDAIASCDEIVGSARQLELLPPSHAMRRPWPSPIESLVAEIEAREHGSVCVLASGDPMLHGIGATLARRVAPARLTVIPHPSAFALACARLGWAEAEVTLLSAVARDPHVVARVLQPGRRVIVYSTGINGATNVAHVVSTNGFGPSRFAVLEQLGGPHEALIDGVAAAWGAREVDALHVVAIECVADADAPLHPLVPGLPDAAYDSDGQLTKRHVRAVTLAALAPTPGALLWDVGAGSGSIAIEWLRAESTAYAVAIESRDDRADRVETNARALGVPGLQVVRGSAPAVLDELEPRGRPDAIFIGGGLTAGGMLERCWSALAPGGRLVANAVTLEGERLLFGAHEQYGGSLVRLEIAHAAPIGGFTGWRPQMPVVQWAGRRPTS